VTTDTAEKLKVQGEDFVNMMEFYSKQDFGYDAMHAWQRISASTQDTLQKAAEIGKDTLEKAVEVGKDTLEKASEVGKNTLEKAVDVSKGALDKTTDTLEKATDVGKATFEKAAEIGKEALGVATEVSRDPFETAAETGKGALETAQEKWGGAKEAEEKLEKGKGVASEWVSLGVKSLGGVQEKASEVVESASDILQATIVGTGETLKNMVGQENFNVVKEKVNDKALEGLQNLVPQQTLDTHTYRDTKGRISQAAYDHARRGAFAGMWRIFPSVHHNRIANNTVPNSWSSLVYRIKSGLLQDEEVHRAISFKAEWNKIDFQQRTDMIVQQLRLLGDDVVEEVVRKLDNEGCAQKCLDYEHLQMCPK